MADVQGQTNCSDAPLTAPRYGNDLKQGQIGTCCNIGLTETETACKEVGHLVEPELPLITQEKRRVVYIYNDSYLALCDKMPKVPKRATLTHALIAAYGLLSEVRLISPRPAREDELTMFHTEDYVKCLHRLSEEDDSEKYDDEAEVFGLTYDCPAYPGVYEYAAYVAGASVKAAQCILMGLCEVAINWPGGWHHAKRDEAEGFCYFNDIVIAILKLRKKYERILYVDLDLHHGDGVEDAFCATSKVLTVSFHKVAPGFFPGTGNLTDVGLGKGKHYVVNVPLKDGIKDNQYVEIFYKVMEAVKTKYDPQVIVCQCGADGLAGDPMDSFNLTCQGMAKCLAHLLTWKIPLLLLGGGGYHLANTARCWAQLTAVATGTTLNPEIPEHEFFTEYGTDYQLDIQAGYRSNHNSSEYVEEVVSTVLGNLEYL